MQKKNGFSFRITKEAGGASGRVLAAAVLFLGLSACLWNGLGLSETGCSPLILAAAGVVYSAAACRLPRRALAFQLAAAAALLIYTVLVSRYIVSGWNVAMNAVFTYLERRLGYRFPRYAETAAALPPAVCAGLFLVLPSVLLGLLSARMVCGRRLWLLPAGVFGAGLILVGLLGLYPPDWAWGLLALGLAMLAAQRAAARNVLAAGWSCAAGCALLFLALLAVSAVPGLAWNGSGTDRARETRQAAGRKLHELRYEETGTTLPEGDFRKLTAFSPEDTTALTITMEKPQALYLRGFVGECYTGSGWSDLEPERRAKYATLFSWLHEQGFYGQTQYAGLCKAVGADKDGGAVSVAVTDACTGWRYAPYGLEAADADPRRIGDEDLPADGIWGETVYEFRISSVPVRDYERMADRLTAARRTGDPAALNYLSQENAYRDFVYENYLEMPEKAQRAIAQALSGLNLPGDGRISFHDAQAVVRAYLSSVVTYSEDPQAIPEGEDFAGGFLLNTKEGYSVHYATAAALLFRYLGIPARYVEGWYLTEADAEAMQPSEPMDLDQSFAHAWVEIYRDGVGFVPFEITPPYTDPAEQTDRTQGSSGGAEILPEEEPTEPLTALAAALISLAVLLVLLLALAAVLAARRAWKRRTLRSLLEAADPAQAVSNMTTWSVKLLGCLGISYTGGSLQALLPEIEKKLGGPLAERYRLVLELHRQALFGRTGLTDAAREAPREFLAELEALLRRRGTRTERFRLRWIVCVI